MESIGRLVMTIMAKPDLESISLGLVSDRLAATPYVMPLKPFPAMTYKAP